MWFDILLTWLRKYGEETAGLFSNFGGWSNWLDGLECNFFTPERAWDMKYSGFTFAFVSDLDLLEFPREFL